MKLIKAIGKAFVNSNVFISLCALLAVWQSYIRFDRPIEVDPLGVLVFASTFLVYNAHRLIKVNQKSQVSEMGRWLVSYLAIIRISMAISVVVIAVAFFKLDRTVQLSLFGLGVISLFYAVPFMFQKTGGLRLRDFGLFKPFLIGLIWAITTIYLPVHHLRLEPNFYFYLAFIQQLLFIAALCIPFDIRDIPFDKKSIRFATIPLKFGVERSITISRTLLYCCMAITFFQQLIFPYDFTEHLLLAASYYVSIKVINLTGQNRSEYFFTFAIDALIALQFVMLFLVDKL